LGRNISFVKVVQVQEIMDTLEDRENVAVREVEEEQVQTTRQLQTISRVMTPDCPLCRQT
jgi:hypothetical protein